MRHHTSHRGVQSGRQWPTGERIEARGVIASAIALGALAAGAAAGGTVASGVIQSKAAGSAARATTNASNYAAQQQAEASRRTEQFQREQAQAAWKAAETDRRGNYDQWAARERRLGSVGEVLGWGPRDIPAYVPSPDPQLLPASVGAVLHPGQPPTSNGQPVMNAPMRAPDPRRTAADPRRTVGAYLSQRRA